MVRVSVENLAHHLDVFLWENPGWGGCDVVMEATQGGRIYARMPVHGKNFDITWKERDIYVCPTRQSEDSE